MTTDTQTALEDALETSPEVRDIDDLRVIEKAARAHLSTLQATGDRAEALTLVDKMYDMIAGKIPKHGYGNMRDTIRAALATPAAPQGDALVMRSFGCVRDMLNGYTLSSPTLTQAAIKRQLAWNKEHLDKVECALSRHPQTQAKVDLEDLKDNVWQHFFGPDGDTIINCSRGTLSDIIDHLAATGQLRADKAVG